MTRVLLRPCFEVECVQGVAWREYKSPSPMILALPNVCRCLVAPGREGSNLTQEFEPYARIYSQCRAS